MERYLLGQGSEEERARFAEDLLANGELHAQVQEFETGQIDALARGLLKPQEAAAWRQFLAETGQLDRLAVAQALARKIHPPQRRLAGWLQIAAALLLMATATWWWTARQVQVAQPPLMASVRISIDLPRDTTRGTSRQQELKVSKDATEVEWRFEVAPEPATGYRLAIRDQSGATVWSKEDKGWPTGVLSILTPAAALPSGTLELELSALDASGTATPVGFHRVRITRL